MLLARNGSRSEQPDEKPETRQQFVIDRLRAWAINGRLRPGVKLSEAQLAEALGVSRTPVRHALAVLVEEGVLHRAGPRGYHVRVYKVADVIETVELRALLEGYAARKLAARGLSSETLAALRECLEEGDAIFADGGGEGVDEDRYAAMNLTFHTLIAESSGLSLFHNVRGLINRVPFGAPDAIRFETFDLRDRARHLQHSHWQHHYIVAAIVAGDGARAEALFREHGELIKVSLGLTKGMFEIGEERIQPIADLDSPALDGRLSRPAS